MPSRINCSTRCISNTFKPLPTFVYSHYGKRLLLTIRYSRLELLKDEFLDVPVRHLENVLREHKTLFKAYGIVEEQLRDYRNVANSFTKIRKARPKRGTLFVMVERGSSLVKELRAAKKKSENDDGKCAWKTFDRQSTIVGDTDPIQPSAAKRKMLRALKKIIYDKHS